MAKNISASRSSEKVRDAIPWERRARVQRRVWNPARRPSLHLCTVPSLQTTLIGTTQLTSNYLHCPHGMQRRVHATVRHPSIRHGVVVSGVCGINEVNTRQTRLVIGWVTVFGRVYCWVKVTLYGIWVPVEAWQVRLRTAISVHLTFTLLYFMFSW